MHPDLEVNGSTTSLAFSSILNEALNLHEAAFLGNVFWPTIKVWGESQNWCWNDVQIRFTHWPVLRILHPFTMDSQGNLTIAGRKENNFVKHSGKLASLAATVEACAAAWFIVLEKAREAKVFLSESDIIELWDLFDCYNLIDHNGTGYGIAILRPLPSRVEYPSVRGHSEISLAEEEYNKRYSDWQKGQQT